MEISLCPNPHVFGPDVSCIQTLCAACPAWLCTCGRRRGAIASVLTVALTARRLRRMAYPFLRPRRGDRALGRSADKVGGSLWRREGLKSEDRLYSRSVKKRSA